ncbi:uncharacterized protein LOC143039345 [Oratosquilla oratoria]|uniref:uncharacterized protein LOC143039345 n=1 Tax=Oratosquilla oratoria TaxID=337810 RepID=UPI003F77074B
MPEELNSNSSRSTAIANQPTRHRRQHLTFFELRHLHQQLPNRLPFSTTPSNIERRELRYYNQLPIERRELRYYNQLPIERRELRYYNQLPIERRELRYYNQLPIERRELRYYNQLHINAVPFCNCLPERPTFAAVSSCSTATSRRHHFRERRILSQLPITLSPITLCATTTAHHPFPPYVNLGK